MKVVCTEKFVKHRFLNSVLFTALFVPLGFFLLRDTIAAITGIMFESIGGKESFLYQINDDIARLIIVGGKLKLGILLALPELIVPLWNFLQIKIYDCRSSYGDAAEVEDKIFVGGYDSTADGRRYYLGCAQ